MFSTPVLSALLVFPRASGLCSGVKERCKLALHPESLSIEVEAHGNRDQDSCNASKQGGCPLDAHVLKHLAGEERECGCNH